MYSRRTSTRSTKRWRLRAWILVAAFASATLLAGLYGTARPEPASAQTTSGNAAVGAFSRGVPRDLANLHEYDADAGRNAAIAEWFQSWEPGSEGEFCVSCARQLYDEGREQLVTWQPQDYTLGTPDQPDYSLDAILSGRHDAYVRRYAQEIERSGVPIHLRLMHEMNANFYPYGEGLNGNTPEKYKQAWVRVYDIFQQEGASNVKWVWGPHVGLPSHDPTYPMSAYYPGDEYVDWIALDGYNWSEVRGKPWYSFEEVFGPSYEEIVAVAPAKPLMIAEYASDERGGDKAQWIRDVRSVVPAKFPKIKALVWFNNDQEGALWRIDSSPAALEAYQELVADPYFQGADLHKLTTLTLSASPTLVDYDGTTTLSGKLSASSGAAVPGRTVEVWHSNDSGSTRGDS